MLSRRPNWNQAQDKDSVLEPPVLKALEAGIHLLEGYTLKWMVCWSSILRYGHFGRWPLTFSFPDPPKFELESYIANYTGM